MILALDCATKTGWCLMKDGKVYESGCQDFSKTRGESNGMVFIRFRMWLQDLALDSREESQERRESLAWAAGFYDGEGSTGCYRQTVSATLKDGSEKEYSSPSLQMGIAQTDRAILERFHSIIGDGSICGPYQDHRSANRRPQWSWKLSGVERVRVALELLWPWLGETKRKQAQDALEAKLVVSSRLHKPKARFGLIAYEQPHYRGGYATELLVGLTGIVQELSHVWTIPCTAVHTGTLKKFAAGSGTADKARMIEAAGKILGRAPIDDNEADAVMLAAYAFQQYGDPARKPTLCGVTG